MSDWNFLNSVRVKVPSSSVPPAYCTTEADGFNGMFRFSVDGNFVRCIASDGMGWKHVSVSLEYEPKKCPKWSLMCKIKDLFWDEFDVVVQFHPRKKDYVNFHQGCLHLWQPFADGAPLDFPCPPSYMVGPKT